MQYLKLVCDECSRVVTLYVTAIRTRLLIELDCSHYALKVID